MPSAPLRTNWNNSAYRQKGVYMIRFRAYLILPVFILVFAIGMLCLNGCAPAPVNADSAPVSADSASVDADSASADAAQTPEPEPEITPIIRDAWYTERCENIARHIAEYTGEDPESALKKAYGMQLDPDQKMVAFTFDDGPNSAYTGEILDILEENNARATFFINGANIEGNIGLLARMLSLGCEIGNHTWDHKNMEELSDGEMRDQVLRVNESLEELFGYKIRLFRPPYIKYGKHNEEIRDRITSLMKEQDMAIVNHTRSTHDTYEEYTADMIYERAIMETDELGHPIDGSIILCHDKSRKTVDAFRRIVPDLIQAGYQLVTVSELLNCSPDGFHPGWIYSKAN